MIVLIPIAFGVPFLAVFVPPAMAVFPAPFASGNEVAALLSNFGTIPAVFFGGFVKFVINVDDSLLAILFVGGTRFRRAEQHRGTSDGGSYEQSFL